jgi:integrase
MTNSNLALNNVIGLNNNSLYNSIELFLSQQGKSSSNTETNYRNHIEKFFMYIFEKNYNEVTWEDILDEEVLNYTRVLQYQLFLSETNSGKTVNTKMASIRSLFKELKRTNNKINTEMFNVKRLPEAKKHYGKLSEEEVNNLLQFSKTIWYKGEEQSIFFETLYVTAIRKEAVLTMTWDDIFQVYDNEIDKMVWVVNPTDKGNKEAYTAIPDQLYEKLLSIKEENSNRVFDFSDDRIIKTFEEYCKAYKIDKKGRNLTIHSIKHSSVVKVYRQSKDMKMAQQHGHHANITTTMDIYADEILTPSKQASYNFYNEVNIKSLDNLTKEQLIEIINMCSNNVKNEIVNKAQKYLR